MSTQHSSKGLYMTNHLQLCLHTKLDLETPTTIPEMQGLFVFLEKSGYTHLSSSSVKALIMKSKSLCRLDPAYTFILWTVPDIFVSIWHLSLHCFVTTKNRYSNLIFWEIWFKTDLSLYCSISCYICILIIPRRW